jgi:hypothetical protein
MAYKSIRNRGKRSKKSNRKTHKQKGGNGTYLMLGLIFLLLLQMNIIVQVDAKFMDGVIDNPLNEKRKQVLLGEIKKYEQDLKQLEESHKSKKARQHFAATFSSDRLKTVSQIAYINTALNTPKDIQDVKNKIAKIENELTRQVMEESKKYLYLTVNEMAKILGPFVLATNYAGSTLSSLLELEENRTWSNYLTRETAEFPIHKMWFDNDHYYAIHMENTLAVIKELLKLQDVNVKLKERLEELYKLIEYNIEPLEEQ